MSSEKLNNKTMLVLSAVILFASLLITAVSASLWTNDIVAYAADTVINVRDISVDYNTDEQSAADSVLVSNGTDILTLNADYAITYRSEKYTESMVPPTNAGVYTVKVYVINSKYTYAEKEVTLTINKIDPAYTFTGNFKQQYGSFTPCKFVVTGKFGEGSVTPDDMNGAAKNEMFSQTSIRYSFGEYSKDITPFVGKYKVVADYAGTENYKSVHVEKDLEIEKRDVFVTISGDIECEYDGYAHVRTITRTGVISADGETFALILKYNGLDTAVDADEYEITIDVNNDNYRIAQITGDAKLIINKKELTVTAQDIAVPYGQTANFTYSYSGFTLTDSEENAIQVKPIIADCPTEVGEYDIVPSGAEAKNYYFVYKNGKLTIQAVHFEGITDGANQAHISIDGVFKPDSKIYLMSYKSNDSLMSSFMEVLTADSQIISKNDVLYSYSVEFSEGGMVEDTATITISNVKFAPLYQTKVAVIDMRGNCHLIEKYTYNEEDGTLTFKTHYVGTVFVYKNARLTYIVAGVGSVVVAVIIILLITAEVAYKRRKAMHSMNIQGEALPTEYEATHKKYKW